MLEDIAYFNGELFERIDVVEMIPDEIEALLKASKMDWSSIEPSILGTLFERGLDPKIRAPLGANYTDPGTIMKLVGPVVVEPLEREWEIAKAKIGPLVARVPGGRPRVSNGWPGGAGALPRAPRAPQKFPRAGSGLRIGHGAAYNVNSAPCRDGSIFPYSVAVRG
ncbi:MAG: hypothetical protein IPQ01_07170 [Zoogloea sp.]|nr:hypothetical protein [Zoogloea sp.]